MDLWDYIDDARKNDIQHLEIEDERSNGDRTVYINRELIFSNRYIDAIKRWRKTGIVLKRFLIQHEKC
jgi:hypothetical protein